MSEEEEKKTIDGREFFFKILIGIHVVNAYGLFACYSNFAWLIIFWCKYVHYIHYRKPVFCNKTILLLSMKKNTYIFYISFLQLGFLPIYEKHTKGTKEVVLRGGHPPFDYKW